MTPGAIPWVVYLILVGWIYRHPEHALLGSPSTALAVGFGLIVLCKSVYHFVLYPDYFTPLKHIPSPPVSLSY